MAGSIVPLAVYLILRRRNRRKQALRVERRALRDASDAFSLNECEFRSRFRVSRAMARELCKVLEPRIARRRSHGLNIQIQILAAMRYYATGCYQRGVGEEFRLAISQSSVSRCITGVTEALVEELGGMISFPRTLEERQRIKSRFMAEKQFPGVIGCIDGTYIPIKRPSNEDWAFRNKKGHYCLNAMLICDNDLRILAVDARYPGSCQDSFVMSASPVVKVLETLHQGGEHNSWLLGDSAYPLKPWLLTPCPDAAVGSPEARYTSALCEAHKCVRKCIGVLKTSWQCLRTRRYMHYSEQTTARMFYACCILHNWMLRERLPLPDEITNLEDDDDVDGDDSVDDDVSVGDGSEDDDSGADGAGPPGESQRDRADQQARALRDQLISDHFSS